MSAHPGEAGSPEPAEVGAGELAGLRESLPDERTTSPERLRHTLRRARRQVGVRDLVTFGLVHIWSGLITILAGVFALVSPGYRRQGARRVEGGSR